QFIDALQLAQLVNYAVRSSRIELGGVGLGKPADVACELNHHRLHSQANSEVGDLRFARVADRLQHSFDTAPAEATGNQDAVERLELGGGLRPFEFFGFDPGNVDLGLMGQPTVQESFLQALVGILVLDVFSDQAD